MNLLGFVSDTGIPESTSSRIPDAKTLSAAIVHTVHADFSPRPVEILTDGEPKNDLVSRPLNFWDCWHNTVGANRASSKMHFNCRLADFSASSHNPPKRGVATGIKRHVTLSFDVLVETFSDADIITSLVPGVPLSSPCRQKHRHTLAALLLNDPLTFMF